MSTELAINEYLGFKTIFNRISPHVKPCLDRLNIWINSQSDAERHKLNQRVQTSVFSYVDTYGGASESPIPEQCARIALIHRTQTDYIADKRALGELVAEHRLFDIAPHIFTTVDAALAFVEANNQPIIFCKGRHGTAGEQVRCIKCNDLANTVLGEYDIFQEAVINPELYENRKMVFRVYVLIHDGVYYYNDRFFAVIHGVDYDPASDAYDVQIKHAGYTQPDSLVKLIPCHFLSGYSRYLAGVRHVAQRMAPLLHPIIRASNAQAYMLLGADLIPTTDGAMKLIEVNNYPNMIHTPEVNNEVNIPMLVGVMKRAIFHADDMHWHACAQ